ncbi:MAG: hypothetical protein ABSF14_21120 [Terriglobia bacterium]|jgi:hypothetical protein
MNNRTNSQRAWEKCQRAAYVVQFLWNYAHDSKSGYYLSNPDRKVVGSVIKGADASLRSAEEELVRACEEDLAEAKARLEERVAVVD